MGQRVVRQAQEANLTNEITLATNASQLDIIQNTLIIRYLTKSIDFWHTYCDII